MMARGSRDPRENEQAMMMSPARKRWWRSDYNIPHLWGFTPTIVCTRLVSCLLGVTGFALRVLLTEDQNNTRTNLSLSPLVKFGPIARLSNPVFLRQHVRVGFPCAHVYDHTFVNVNILFYYFLTENWEKKILTKITINVNLEEVGAAMEGNKFFFLTRETFVHTNIWNFIHINYYMYTLI